MPNAELLPQTAPFELEHREQLDRVLGAATPLQRAWLSGFLAGLDRAANPPTAEVAAPQKAVPLTILFASESGNSEALAHGAAKLAKKSGFKPRVIDFADLDIATLAKESALLVIAATWGEGEPPARAVRAYNELMSDAAPKLAGTRFSVLSLGDSAYVEFCGIGKALDARLEALGGQRVADRVDCDLDFDKPAADWTRAVLTALAPEQKEATNVVAVDFGRGGGEVSREPVSAEVIEHVNLNSSRSAKETVHLALQFDGPAPAYEPGDSLEVFAPNDTAVVTAVLVAAGLEGDEALAKTLHEERDITTLSLPTLDKYAAATGNADLRKLIDAGEAKAWIVDRQLVDLIEAFPAKIDAAQLIALTRPLPPRAYSIASSRREFEEEAHLLVSAVRYETHGRTRTGVASTHIADRLKVGGSLRVRVKPNKHFRLPQLATDIIMVGPGTGVAPFRAFVQERRATNASGRNWLFFGDRQFTHDFLYQLEWQDALGEGALNRIDLAFSRDTPEKVYVQHRIFEQRKDLVAWLDSGAHFYVCGDAKAMAKDVRAALVNAYADVKGLAADAAEAAVTTLEREKRYLQDVY
ncbi:sulfite reductase [NADPH] flavoprotein alpha-component [Variibacter gotjawalensis]|uniref:assimilatory sulfite reductase (NADPH) n=1 Tax=Variibacter gotjawalensis TaxID=1333996 RepID=A0A0S3PQZ5_9BRAD|nr:flavodoxin domain-containing protein [Variibacter gotjawalensis]NIK48601.1 sulfite reductase (NADPH) flavoprotein alpha-component [Variibacter gotjawalensis]RZS50466.1 sulfite reductase (NADPH) flavoprotein alpha-component [Variibacter gotjawalensis]BAT58300.1 sulfite reductase [NADPH] flavoprotein alpha-component [Variibacter gotjawalensis]